MEPAVDQHFTQLIVPEILEDAILEIPIMFVKEHGRNLPRFAYLQVPTGRIWRVDLKKDSGHVWLEKGWQTFVRECAVKKDYILVFRYEGGSSFQVVICNAGGSEIAYPSVANQTSNLHQPQVVYKKEEGDDDSDVVILDEWPLQSKDKLVANDDDDSAVIILDEWPLQTNETPVANQPLHQFEGVPTSTARDRVLQKARTFQSPHPYFTVIITPMNDHSYVYLPSDATSHFREKKDDIIYLNGPDSKTWEMKFCIEDPPMSKVRIFSRWKEFVEQYRLQDGDACIFELIYCSRVMIMNVSTFQITVDEVGRNDRVGIPDVPVAQAVEMHDIPSPRTGRSEVSDSTAVNSPIPSQHIYPSFTFQYTAKSRSLQQLHVPMHHGRKYLSKLNGKQVFLRGLDGQTWPVTCSAEQGKRIRLSTGWKDFAIANHLKKWDVLEFELISRGPNRYNVNISRAAE